MSKPLVIEVRGDEGVVVVWASVSDAPPPPAAPVVIIETTGESVS